jgi:hypothetical protein
MQHINNKELNWIKNWIISCGSCSSSNSKDIYSLSDIKFILISAIFLYK